MTQFLLALAFPLAVSTQSVPVSAPTSSPSSLTAPTSTTAETVHSAPVTESAPTQVFTPKAGASTSTRPEPAGHQGTPWEFMVGGQMWRGQGNIGIGWAMGRHEIRLLGPTTGLYVDYKATLARIKGLRFNVGALAGAPALFGGHLGVLYRTGGDSFWGRVAFGVDAGASCARQLAVVECAPGGGLNLGLYFWPSDLEL